jgi:diguanylate cyclase (GGDEF)-like protein
MLRHFVQIASRLRSRREQVRASPRTAEPADAVDAITGLPTRDAFDALATAAMESAGVERRTGCALYAGLDGFRLVNERCGDSTGDAVLREAGRVLREEAGEDGLVCRVTGDEFAVWLDLPMERAEVVADRMVASFGSPLIVDGQPHQLGLSLGMAVFPEHGTRSRIMAHAAAAMRAVKREGGHARAVFSAQVGATHRDHADLLRDLRQAVDSRSGLELYYQPVVDSATRQVCTAEALLRWRHPTRGLVDTALLIDLAERNGLLGVLGEWVLDEALTQAGKWQGLRPPIRVAINISGQQLRLGDFPARLGRQLREGGLQPGRIGCEIAQRVARQDSPIVRRALEGLHKLGVDVAIAGIGADESLLASLRELPAASLKIDRRAVAAVVVDEAAHDAVRALVRGAHDAGRRVVATGVENEAERKVLMALGCDEMQGYLFAKPMNARAFGIWATDAPSALSPVFGSSHFRTTLAQSTQAMTTRA